MLICYHKPAILLEGSNDVFVPIHVGREVDPTVPMRSADAKKHTMSEKDKQWLLDKMIGDNTGENISLKNRRFNEMTGVYWAWKNQKKLANPDYIGLMMYRRHLAFAPGKKTGEVVFEVEKFDKDYQKEYGLDSQSIKNTIKGYDIVLPQKQPINWANNAYEAEMESLSGKENLDLALDIFASKHPHYKQDIKTWKTSQEANFCNLFVMKTPIFNRFCEVAFSVLFETEKQIDVSMYDPSKISVEGYLTEALINIFKIHELRTNPEIKILELTKTFAKNTDVGISTTTPTRMIALLAVVIICGVVFLIRRCIKKRK